MRYLWIYLAALILLLIVLPWVLVSSERPLGATSLPGMAAAPINTDQTWWPAPSENNVDTPQITGIALTTADDNEPMVQLWLAAEQRSISISLEEYVVCAAAAEMPALFQDAALQAQAIAIRTYTLKRLQQQDKRSGHPEGDLCDQPGHCQAYLSSEALKQRWQQTYATYWERVNGAAGSTVGLVLSYRGQLIDALYHSTCGGRTEYAGEVWGEDPFARSYLIAVSCPWDHDSNRYSSSVFFTWQELGIRLGLEDAAVQVALLSSAAWNITELTVGGRVKQATLLGQGYSGTVLRGKLGLNSTQLRVTQSTVGLTFEATGYGHGVGLCQYGANGYAKTGANYIEILGHYYTGVTILPNYGR